ncbi:cytochrome P450 4V2-like [Epargyreus clarus]|uniref:cytochrome P450 4V2-like n=1 Tax=Epargyreus clarus TaxID=520877 RepID=UPI003C2FF0BA
MFAYKLIISNKYSIVVLRRSIVYANMFIILTLLTISVLYLWLRRPLPGEPPVLPGYIPLIGHAYRFLGDTTYFWKTLKTMSYTSLKKGGVILWCIGPMKIYMVTDPDECITIANTCLDKDKITRKFTGTLLGNGLPFGPANIWKNHRKVMNPAFNQQVLDGFIGLFNKQSRKLTDTLSKEVGKGPFDQSYYFQPISLESICLTTMGLDISADNKQNEQFVEAIDKVMMICISRFQRLWLHSDFIYSWSSMSKKQDEYTKVIHDMIDAVLQRRKTESKLNNNKTETYNNSNNGTQKGSGTKFKPLMDLLLELEGGIFSDQDVRDETGINIIAGYETVAGVLTYFFLLIGSFPHVQEKIVTELEEVLGKEHRDVTKQDLSLLVYLEAVIKETLRFYPIVSFVTRSIDKVVKLKNCTLRPGHTCVMSLYGVSRHPIWGEDAERFRPERWLDSASLPSNPNAFLAFGVGKRNCIGQVYAMMSMKITIAHVLRNYRVTGDHTKMKLKFEVLLKPVSGHYISIEKRA